MIIYNGDPHRVRQDAHPTGDGVPTKQSGWRKPSARSRRPTSRRLGKPLDPLAADEGDNGLN